MSHSEMHDDGQSEMMDTMRDIARRADKFVEFHDDIHRAYYHSMAPFGDDYDDYIDVDDDGVGHLRLVYGHSWDNHFDEMLTIINEVTRVYPLAYVGMDDAEWARCEGERGSVWNLHFVTTEEAH